MASKLDEEDLQALSENPTSNWYILKCQVNREDKCVRTLRNRVIQSGLEKYVDVDKIFAPIRKEEKFDSNGKKRVTREKKFPGYLIMKMVLNEETWFLIRETPGVGDFAGSSGRPVPMKTSEGEQLYNEAMGIDEVAPTVHVPYAVGDKVSIVSGEWQGLEGEVTAIDTDKGTVTVSMVLMGNLGDFLLDFSQVVKKDENM